MKTIDIKGKPYVPVSERLKHFLDSEEYKGWTINTGIVQCTETWIVMESVVYDADKNARSNAFASETKEGHINKTSYIENCHTSCVGRALGMLGIGIDAEIASAEEVAIARDATPDQITQIENLLSTCSLDEATVSKVESEMVTLTYVRAEKCISYLWANQKNRIESGENYNQGDINRQLDLKIQNDKS